MVVECVDNITTYLMAMTGILSFLSLVSIVWGIQSVKKSKNIEGLLQGLTYKVPDLGPYLNTIDGKKRFFEKEPKTAPQFAPPIDDSDEMPAGDLKRLKDVEDLSGNIKKRVLQHGKKLETYSTELNRLGEHEIAVAKRIDKLNSRVSGAEDIIAKFKPQVEKKLAEYVSTVQLMEKDLAEVRKQSYNKETVQKSIDDIHKNLSLLSDNMASLLELDKNTQNFKVAIQELYGLMSLAADPSLEPEKVSEHIRRKLNVSKHYERNKG